MAFETNKFNVVKKKRLASSEFAVECNVETGVEIDKILSVQHHTEIETVEILSGTINYNGNIDLSVVFSTPDGEIGTTSAVCPFSSKFEDEDVMLGDKVTISVSILDFQVSSVANGTIKISCTCEQKGILISNKEVMHADSEADDICLKKDDITVNMFTGQAQEVFEAESVVSIKEPIKKIVMTDSQASIKSVESGDNFVGVNGEVITKILYITQNDRFETSYTSETFKEEVELEGATRENVVDAEVYVKNSLVRCEVEEEDKGVKIKMTIPVKLIANAYEEKKESIVKDLYSTKNELQVSTESFEMTKQYQTETFETKIDGALTLDEDKPRVDKIMFVGASNLLITNSYIKDGELFVEGIAKTNVVYLNDETNALHSVVIEVPFVVSDKTNIDADDVNVFVVAMLYDVDVVVKKGREFYFDGKLRVTASYDADVVEAVISNVENGAERKEKDCAIEVYFGSEGDDSWNIAKGLGIDEQTLYEQNPETVFPLEKDENLVVYYQKKA